MFDHIEITNIADDDVHRPDPDTEVDVSEYSYIIHAMEDMGPRGTAHEKVMATEITINGGGNINTSGEAAISRQQGIGIDKRGDVKRGLIDLEIR